MDQVMDEPALAARFGALQAAFRSDPVPSLSWRRDKLLSLATCLRAHADEIATAISRDFGHRSRHETRLLELGPALEEIRHARRHLGRWMKPRRRSTGIVFQPARNHVVPQPLGVAGVIVPWNFPVFLAVGPLVSALAAGNRVLLKMSEYTPETGALLAALLPRYLGEDAVQVVNGGVEVATAFTALPFDHLLFTGSTAVGRHVMRAAAANLTPVTLELGGKSPALVAADADLVRAAESIVTGKMANAGQICVAPDYVLVPHAHKDALVAAITAAATRMYPDLADNPDYTAIIDARQYARLQGWLAAARTGGATVLEINPAGEAAGVLAAQRKMPLTLVFDAPQDTPLMQEEIFGPILPLVTYGTLDEAIAHVNARPRPLALYLFSDDAAVQARVERETVSGALGINETVQHVGQCDLPFGGVGPSGMGHYHGHEGFLTFSKLKPVFVQSRLSGTRLARPPYGTVVELILRFFMGRKC